MQLKQHSNVSWLQIERRQTRRFHNLAARGYKQTTFSGLLRGQHAIPETGTVNSHQSYRDKINERKSCE